MEIQLPSDTRHELLAKMCYRDMNTLAVVYLTNMGNFVGSNKSQSVWKKAACIFITPAPHPLPNACLRKQPTIWASEPKETRMHVASYLQQKLPCHVYRWNVSRFWWTRRKDSWTYERNLEGQMPLWWTTVIREGVKLQRWGKFIWKQLLHFLFPLPHNIRLQLFLIFICPPPFNSEAKIIS